MNLKTKVIAAAVTNLTDARYFAAWGVDYMAHIIDDRDDQYIGIEGTKEIIDWVEGPKHMGLLSGADTPANCSEIYTALELEALMVSPFIDVQTVEHVSPTVYRTVLWDSSLLALEEELLIVKLPDATTLEDIASDLQKVSAKNIVYLDIHPTVADLTLVLQSIRPEGIVLRGGEEEKVGFKSYDELDDIFEYLEED